MATFGDLVLFEENIPHAIGENEADHRVVHGGDTFIATPWLIGIDRGRSQNHESRTKNPLHGFPHYLILLLKHKTHLGHSIRAYQNKII